MTGAEIVWRLSLEENSHIPHDRGSDWLDTLSLCYVLSDLHDHPVQVGTQSPALLPFRRGELVHVLGREKELVHVLGREEELVHFLW